jgi:tRNA nucleotidyltransferase (CCA-adding enzyme)
VRPDEHWLARTPDEAGRPALAAAADDAFAADPARVWVLARRAADAGTPIEPRTRALAAAADPFAIDPARHGEELRLALDAPDPGAVLATVLALNPRFLPPGFRPDPPGLADALALLPAGARADLVRLAACCAGVDLLHLLPWTADTGWTDQEREVLGAGSRAATAAPLRSARTDDEIRRAASGVPVEVVALAGGPNARRWIEVLRHEPGEGPR